MGFRKGSHIWKKTETVDERESMPRAVKYIKGDRNHRLRCLSAILVATLWFTWQKSTQGSLSRKEVSVERREDNSMNLTVGKKLAPERAWKKDVDNCWGLKKVSFSVPFPFCLSVEQEGRRQTSCNDSFSVKRNNPNWLVISISIPNYLRRGCRIWLD